MKFEHRIAINDFSNPSLPIFTREQLWGGLVLRAESPQLFLPNLDSCTITSRDLYGFTRALQFGDLTIYDRVQFQVLDYVHYQVHRQGDIPESNLRMTIEEIGSSNLSICFSYANECSENEDAQNALYNDYRCAAYKESDVEAIKILRQMHQAGRFNEK